MQDGCKVYMDSYMASNGSCFMVTWTILKTHLVEVSPTQHRKTNGTPNVHNRWFFLFYQKYSLKQHLVEDPVTYDFTLQLRIRDRTT